MILPRPGPTNPLQHACECVGCNAEVAEQLSVGLNHFGIQFPGQAARLRVVKTETGEDISHSCWQVIAGYSGRAWRFTQPIHVGVCCDKFACAYVEHGHFTVVGEVQ